MNEKIALIIPANIWYCPFIKIYTKLFDEWGIGYDIIYWNKSGLKEEGISFNMPAGHSSLSKFISYYKFSKFVKKTILKNKYSKLIVFMSQVGILSSGFLKKYYNKKYIFDFRDLSIEQNPLFKQNFKTLLQNSYANVISSPGFLSYLPKKYKYIISHNFDINNVREHLNDYNGQLPDNPIDILTIGGIRDYSANAPIIDSLGNKKDFKLRFVGKGPAALPLENLCKYKGYKNVFFYGFYKKEEEESFIKDCSFINIYYPQIKTHSSALSNRFYFSLIYRKPMIVTEGQLQGEYCKKYNLGVVVNDVKTLPNDLISWIHHNDYKKYNDRCINLLKNFVDDYLVFKEMLRSFAFSKD